MAIHVTTPICDPNSTRDSKTKTYTYPHLPLLKTYTHGMAEDEEEPLYGEKTRSLESRLMRKHKKNQHLQEWRAAHT